MHVDGVANRLVWVLLTEHLVSELDLGELRVELTVPCISGSRWTDGDLYLPARSSGGLPLSLYVEFISAYYQVFPVTLKPLKYRNVWIGRCRLDIVTP